MTDDEAEVEAKPFPKYWLWIPGLYAAAIVAMFCVGMPVELTQLQREKSR